jgi:parvulin-like peptidyl-prolyl isomerase
MKRLSLVFGVLACLPAVAGAQVVEEIITRVNNQIITKSEYQRSKDQLKEEVKQQNPPDPDKVLAQREKDVLRDLIDQQLLLEKGKDLSISADTDLIKALDEMRKEMKLDSLEDLEKEATKQGISWEDFKQARKNQIITQKVIGQEVGSHLSITKEEAQAFYDEHKDEMVQPESIKLSEILVTPKPVGAPASAPAPGQPAAQPATTQPGASQPDASPAATQPAPTQPATTSSGDATSTPAPGSNPFTSAAANAQPADEAARQVAEATALKAAEAKANDLLKQIKDGAAFEDVAKKNSDGPSAAEGGTLGVFERGKLAKELEDKTFAMKPGEVTDVIRTKQGYVILKVEEHTPAGVPAMKDVLPRIQDALYYQKLQPALRTFLTKLREEAYIFYMPGYTDSGMSPNQTNPVETAAAKESDAKKLKKKKKLGFL